MPTNDTAPKPPALDDDQHARAAALDAARAVLAERGPFGASGSIDAMDLVHVATWIIDGRDPWADTGEGEPC